MNDLAKDGGGETVFPNAYVEVPEEEGTGGRKSRVPPGFREFDEDYTKEGYYGLSDENVNRRTAEGRKGNIPEVRYCQTYPNETLADGGGVRAFPEKGKLGTRLCITSF